MIICYLILSLFFQFPPSPPANVHIIRMSTVTNLSGSHRVGVTYLTWDVIIGAGVTYDLYRSQSPITTLVGLTKIPVPLTQESYRLLYDDSGITDGQNLTSGLIITDNGSHLPSTKGFAAIITHIGETGSWYYAVVNSTDQSLVSGVNSLSSPIAETYADAPGGVVLNSSIVGSYTVVRTMFWEDIRTWVHADWNYYGERVNFLIPNSGISPPFPTLTILHGAGTTNYFEPTTGFGGIIDNGIIIQPVELDFASISDPYTGKDVPSASWICRFNTSEDVWKTVSEDRLVRYSKIVRDNLLVGVNFQADPNRISIYGASLGSSAAHIAGHHPEVYAAGGSAIGYASNGAGFFPNGTKKVNSASGPTLNDYLDFAYQAAHVQLPPLSFTFGSRDPTGVLNPVLWEAVIPALDTYHQAYFVEWFDDVHNQRTPSYPPWDFNAGPNNWMRFRKNQAYLAFSNLSSNDAVPSFPGNFAGQHNGKIDYQSDGHPITSGFDIVDQVGFFSAYIRPTTDVAAGLVVTVRNAQLFKPNGTRLIIGTPYDGYAVVNTDGSVSATLIALTANTTYHLSFNEDTVLSAPVPYFKN